MCEHKEVETQLIYRAWALPGAVLHNNCHTRLPRILPQARQWHSVNALGLHEKGPGITSWDLPKHTGLCVCDPDWLRQDRLWQNDPAGNVYLCLCLSHGGKKILLGQELFYPI